jgi:hypothetical protein
MKLRFALIPALLLPGASLRAASAPAVDLPEFTVYSTEVANQEPVGTFAMPVSVLRFEPRVDLQARNLAEGQSDIAIRGGIFENTGIRLGALSLYDPQTGHYLAELPVAPAMLGSPTVLTGADNAQQGWNANAGTIAYGWRPIRDGGFLELGGGQFNTDHEEVYEGKVSDSTLFGRQLATDTSYARSASDGSRPYGESRFDRVSARVQLADAKSQTDLVYGYQAKFFGWPNLYTPFNSDETENLETVLVALNHRQQFSQDDFVEFGASWRRNKDDYAFNRFAPVGPVHPFQHTTWMSDASLDGKVTFPAFSLGYKAGVGADDLKSTSLTAGRFHTRTYTNAGLFPEKRWVLAPSHALVVTAGAAYDDTNRRSSRSPTSAAVPARPGSASIFPTRNPPRCRPTPRSTPVRRPACSAATRTSAARRAAISNSASAGLGPAGAPMPRCSIAAMTSWWTGRIWSARRRARPTRWTSTRLALNSSPAAASRISISCSATPGCRRTPTTARLRSTPVSTRSTFRNSA